MKLVMTLLVRDEEDIVGANIDFHLKQGVDFIVAMDNLSVDRTPQLLRSYEKRGLLHYILQSDDNYMQHRWVTHMARLASTKFGADWVINSDADEFWYPDGGDLKQVLNAIPPSYDAVAVERTNFVPTSNEAGEFFAKAMTVRESKSLNALGQPLPGKVCHRAHVDIEVEQGNHVVRRDGYEIAVTNAAVTILHFPMRSYRQFANKIALGGAAYARNIILPPSAGSTWRHLYEVWKKGGLEHYYQSLIPSNLDIEQNLRAGYLVKDIRLSEFFDRKAVIESTAIDSEPASVARP